MNRTTAQQKAQNKRRTKQEILCKIEEIQTQGDDLIIVEASKRRVTFTINEFVMRQIEATYSNKSKFVEDLLIEVVEDLLHKKIKFSKNKENY